MITETVKQHQTTLTLLFLIIVAGLLRFYRLDTVGLWVDEIFTALFASPDKNLSEVARGPLNSPLPTPPLWFFVTHFFMKVFGTSEWAVRLPSALAGLLAIIVIYKVGETFFDHTVGLISAFLLTISPYHIYFSREARFYAAIVLFSLLTIYFIHQATNSNQKKWWFGFILATLCSIYGSISIGWESRFASHNEF